MTLSLPVAALRQTFGERLQENVSLAPFTSARIGGPADVLVTVNSADELAEAAARLWEMEIPFKLLGGGSNVLVSDQGVRGVVVLNRAKAVKFETGEHPIVWAESGVIFSNLANRVAAQGFAGLEWAASIPGTLGGAVYGNAGAFGGDISGNLVQAEVQTRAGRELWPAEKFAYGYRTSVLKRHEVQAIILSTTLTLKNGSKEEVSIKMQKFTERRKNTQPPGASMGSMFKNPPGEAAGRLIEAAGLKGTRIGNVEISTQHANFFVNHGETRAADVRALVELAQKTVMDKFGVVLELEVELIGEWS